MPHDKNYYTGKADPGYEYVMGKGYIPKDRIPGLDPDHGPIPQRGPSDIPHTPRGSSAPTAMGAGAKAAGKAGVAAGAESLAAEAGAVGKVAGKVGKASKWLKWGGGLAWGFMVLDLLDQLHEMTLGEKQKTTDEKFADEQLGRSIRGGVVGEYGDRAEEALNMKALEKANFTGSFSDAMSGVAEGDLASLIMGRENQLRQMSIPDKPSVLDLLARG